MRRLAWALALVAVLGFAGRARAQGSAQHDKPVAGHTGAKGEHAAGEPDGEEAHEGEHHELGSINWLDFGNTKQPPWGAYAINFAILATIYWYFGRKGVASALKERRAEVAKEIEEAQRLRREAETRAAKYQEKLEHLEADLESARKALVDAGVGERERLIKEGEEKAARLERDALFLVEQELKQMRQDLVRETAELAVAAAADLLRAKITHADHEQLAEEYLAHLAATSSGTQKGAPS